ncbi:aldo/keto reductase [Acetobacter okinawensis]|uniref:aldo/keto reductase n=1 Tax=Acetobacter okinawensis TaxID=1076594 RepID=UPI001BAD0000|nr:aldo/keto reductase [Acetobacter okinawensis]MBS0966470.1 aldo/keto reductase [Acetobacter okinawensis]
MQYRKLGNTGLFVSNMCLGTMTFGGKGFWKKIGALDQTDANGLVARALDHGINFIDTADVYSEGLAEEITGRALKESSVRRSDVVLATKGFAPMGKGPNDRGASRGHIMNAVKESLRRLDTDYIDLYQIHGLDTLTPVEETLRALDDLIRAGHIRYIGISNWPAWATMKAICLARAHNWSAPASVQAYYTVVGRDIERELIPLIKAEDLALLVWSPLAGGLLSGKFRSSSAEKGARRADFDFPPVDNVRANSVLSVIESIALTRNVSVAQISLAWLLYQKAVTSIILGVKNFAQLDDNLASAAFEFTPEELDLLDSASKLSEEYPGWIMRYQSEEARVALGAK